MQNLIRENFLLVNQGEAFVAALPDTVFCAENTVSGTSSVGKHFRHIINHYDALLNCGSGRIDYDARERGVEMEISRALTIAKLQSLAAQLASLKVERLSDAIEVEKLNAAADGKLTLSLLPSSFARELAFVQQHTTHHYAVIRLIAVEHGVAAPFDFGMSPATLRYLATPQV